MTTAADLQLRTGADRRLFCRIDGINYDFWQAHEVAAPSATAADVVWTNEDNVTVDGNKITKSGTGWNGGGTSTSTIVSGASGQVDFTVRSNAETSICGLSNGDTDYSVADVDFGIRFTSSAYVDVYESGTIRTTSNPTYVSGDVFTVKVTGTVVTYHKNGAAAFYTSAVTPTFPLLVDAAIYNDGGILDDVQLTSDEGWRTALECLDVDSEASNGLDVRELKAESGALTIRLRNCYDTTPTKIERTNDPNATYLLAQMFAPGRASTGYKAHLRAKTVRWLKPNDDTIYTDDNTDFDASGTAYIGSEPFSYDALGTDGGYFTFTGVTRGLYPCVGSDATFSQSAAFYDPYDEQGHQGGIAVTQYPATMLGKRIALYVATLQVDGTWPTFSGAELLWAGYLSDQLNYNAETGEFELSCVSLLEWLDTREIGSQLRISTLRGINLTGGDFLDYQVEVFDTAGAWGLFAKFNGTVGAGFYESPAELVQAVAESISAAAVAAGGGTTVFGYGIDEGHAALSAGYGQTGLTWNIYSPNGRPNLAFHALGYRNGSASAPDIVIQPDNGSGGVSRAIAPDAPFDSFHSHDRRVNGDKLYTDFAAEYVIADQGDWGAAAASRGYLLLSNTVGGTGVVAFTGNDATTPDAFTLDPVQPIHSGPYHYAGSRTDEEPAEVRQCFFQENKFQGKGAARGPFEALLYPLLSTGTAAGVYNGAYDSMAPHFAVGMQDDLVDTQSFLDADALIASKTLAQRPYYLVMQSAKSWGEILRRECKLFGFALVQARGKIKIVRLPLLRADTYTETLTEGTNAQIAEHPVISLSSESIVNAWEVKPYYSEFEDDFDDRTIKIIDQDSVDAVLSTHMIELEHPGLLNTTTPHGELVTEITKEFRAWNQFFAYPNYRIDVTLAPIYANRVAIGDVVRWQSTQHPDPYGSGTMAVDALALVVDYAPSWGGEMAWTARVSLLVYTSADALALTPWGPGALVTEWSDEADTLTLAEHTFGTAATDNEDGVAFVEDDEIRVVWTHPTDPASGQSLGPFAVTSYTAGTNILALSGSPDLSALVSGREYMVIPADWGDAPAAQRLLGLWQAAKATRKLSTDAGLRYG